MNALGFLGGILLGFAMGLALRQLLRLRRPPVLTTTVNDWWVYLPEAKLPAQDAVMARLHQAGSLSSREMLLWSDVRLHIGLVRRSENPHCFVPGLQPNLEPTTGIAEGIAESEAFARIRFISERPLVDRAHVRVLLFIAATYALLGEAKVVLDNTQERAWTASEFLGHLRRAGASEEASDHVRVLWHESEEGFRCETLGLVKIGRPELQISTAAADLRTLIRTLVEQVVQRIWTDPDATSPVEVEAFGDRFTAEWEPNRQGKARLMMRRQPNS